MTATECDNLLHLTPTQQTAVDLLLARKNDRDGRSGRRASYGRHTLAAAPSGFPSETAKPPA